MLTPWQAHLCMPLTHTTHQAQCGYRMSCIHVQVVADRSLRQVSPAIQPPAPRSPVLEQKQTPPPASRPTSAGTTHNQPGTRQLACLPMQPSTPSAALSQSSYLTPTLCA